MTFFDSRAAWPFNETDLRIDVYRDAGARPSKALVRVTHIPTGNVVDCGLHDSIFVNKTVALARLTVRLEGEADPTPEVG